MCTRLPDQYGHDGLSNTVYAMIILVYFVIIICVWYSVVLCFTLSCQYQVPDNGQLYSTSTSTTIAPNNFTSHRFVVLVLVRPKNWYFQLSNL